MPVLGASSQTQVVQPSIVAVADGFGTITKPSGLQTGDLVLVAMGGSGVVTAPSPFTIVSQGVMGTGSNRYCFAWARLGSGDLAAGSWAFTNGAGNTLVVLRGATQDPVFGTVVNAGGSANINALTMPAVTVSPVTRVLRLLAYASNGTAAPIMPGSHVRAERQDSFYGSAIGDQRDGEPVRVAFASGSDYAYLTVTVGTALVPTGLPTLPSPDDLGQFNAIYGSGFTALDQEFARSGSPTTLPTGWSWTNQGTSTYVERGGAGIITPQVVAGNERIIDQPMTGIPATWDLYAKIALFSSGNDWSRASIGLTESSSGKLVQFGLTNRRGLHLNLWTTATTFNTQILEDNSLSVPLATYLRVRKNSATSYDFYWSPDGIAWYDYVIGQNLSTFCTPDRMGFVSEGATSLTRSGIHWLRVR